MLRALTEAAGAPAIGAGRTPEIRATPLGRALPLGWRLGELAGVWGQEITLNADNWWLVARLAAQSGQVQGRDCPAGLAGRAGWQQRAGVGARSLRLALG